ncbi:3-oxoacyl-ACP synthase III family protein [Actinophytocola sp.]|jgi:3-oxoacyl-[acyl-carrier-protein] synthase-3|uniref:3-oxoacyl-ACP synthase III family protein n=1 Tax=Actinophytocola sp. TaxID=1872138 RepID=UPI002EDAE411
MTFGVVGTGHSLGEEVPVDAAVTEYLPDPRAIRGWGYRAFHRAPAGVGLTDLAVLAAQKALAGAGVAAADLDLVVLAMSDIPEYLYWDAAAAVQAGLAAHRAEAVLANQACGGGVTAFDTVAGRFATHEDHRVALIVGANRVCEAYCNRMALNTCVNGDGAAAVVVRRGHPAWQWLVTETVTDGRHADLLRLPAGGAARPFTAGSAGSMRIGSAYDRLEARYGADVVAMAEFAGMTLRRTRQVLERACERAGVAPGSVARIVHLHDNLPALTDLAGELGVPLSRTNADLAAAHGHLGCADQLLGIDHLIASGELAPGDVVALTSVGSGMHWACTLLQV